MGHIEDNQALCQGRKSYCELPGDCTAPVVPDNDGFISSDVADDGLHISYQVIHQVILTSLRFIAKVVAAQIDRYDLEVLGQRSHLVAPGRPENRESMDHDNQWSLAYTGIMNVYSIIVRIMICHVYVDIIGNY